MKKHIILTIAITLSSSTLLAAGAHSGGHDGHDMSKMMAPHWASPSDALNKENPVHSDAASIAKGSEIFQNNCISCHGKNADGKGPSAAFLNPKPTNLKAMAGMHPDGDFAWKIANGRGPMPAWKSLLSDNDIWHTVNFLQSLKKTNDSHGGGHGGGHH
jgi:mono/diheme cytochrome c family protein